MNKLKRYGVLNSHDLLKLLALSLMIVDHMGKYFFPEILWFRLLGRGAAPLFFFLIGYHSKLNITFPLLFYGVVLSINNGIQLHHLFINILINFVLSFWFVRSFSLPQRSVRFLLILFALLTVMNIFIYPFIEYGLLGLMFMISARLIQKHYRHAILFLIYSLSIYFLWESATFNWFASPLLLGSMIILMCVLLVIMLSFQLKKYIGLKAVQWPLLVLSRYSLEVYFIHILAFELLQKYLYIYTNV